MNSRAKTVITECYWAARVKGNCMREGWKKVWRARTLAASIFNMDALENWLEAVSVGPVDADWA